MGFSARHCSIAYSVDDFVPPPPRPLYAEIRNVGDYNPSYLSDVIAPDVDKNGSALARLVIIL